MGFLEDFLRFYVFLGIFRESGGGVLGQKPLTLLEVGQRRFQKGLGRFHRMFDRASTPSWINEQPHFPKLSMSWDFSTLDS